MPGVQHDEGQLALIAHAERDPRHVVCLARAGTGKTTTLRAALPRMRPGLKRVLAFNRDIADEWRRWKEKHNRIDLEVATFHALAIKTVSAWVGKHVEVDRMRGRNIARRVALGWQKQERAAGRNPGDFQRGEYVLLGDEVWSEMPWNLHKFVELLKNVHPTDLAQVERLAKAHGYANKVVPASVWARLGARCLRISRETFSDKLDFADAMYLPRWFGWRPAPVRDVLVDELQDMNTAQLWLARASLDPTDGRLVAIGDDRQAIYHWRGADPEGVQTTIKELNACIVRMSVTYRCARRVVEHVRSAVEGLEDFTARPDAPEGTVQARTMTDLIGPFGANLGDFVLSRSNAPLIVLAAHWLRRHVPLVVSGKDIGVSLLSLVERADCRSNRELFNWLVDYLVAEESRLDGDVETLRDITDRVHALQALVAETQDPEDLCNTLRQMYRLPPPKRARKWGASGAGVSAARHD